MKKTELLHVHSLLGTVAKDLAERDELSNGDLETYRDLGVSPMTIRASREDHEEAVIALADALATSIEGQTTEEADDADSRRTLTA